MENTENPTCEDCGRHMRMRPFSMVYAWFCHYCNRFDERVEIVIMPQSAPKQSPAFIITKNTGFAGDKYNLFLQPNSHFF